MIQCTILMLFFTVVLEITAQEESSSQEGYAAGRRSVSVGESESEHGEKISAMLLRGRGDAGDGRNGEGDDEDAQSRVESDWDCSTTCERVQNTPLESNVLGTTSSHLTPLESNVLGTTSSHLTPLESNVVGTTSSHLGEDAIIRIVRPFMLEQGVRIGIVPPDVTIKLEIALGNTSTTPHKLPCRDIIFLSSHVHVAETSIIHGLIHSRNVGTTTIGVISANAMLRTQSNELMESCNEQLCRRHLSPQKDSKLSQEVFAALELVVAHPGGISVWVKHLDDSLSTDDEHPDADYYFLEGPSFRKYAFEYGLTCTKFCPQGNERKEGGGGSVPPSVPSLLVHGKELLLETLGLSRLIDRFKKAEGSSGSSRHDEADKATPSLPTVSRADVYEHCIGKSFAPHPPASPGAASLSHHLGLWRWETRMPIFRAGQHLLHYHILDADGRRRLMMGETFRLESCLSVERMPTSLSREMEVLVSPIRGGGGGEAEEWHILSPSAKQHCFQNHSGLRLRLATPKITAPPASTEGILESHLHLQLVRGAFLFYLPAEIVHAQDPLLSLDISHQAEGNKDMQLQLFFLLKRSTHLLWPPAEETGELQAPLVRVPTYGFSLQLHLFFHGGDESLQSVRIRSIYTLDLNHGSSSSSSSSSNSSSMGQAQAAAVVGAEEKGGGASRICFTPTSEPHLAVGARPPQRRCYHAVDEDSQDAERDEVLTNVTARGGEYKLSYSYPGLSLLACSWGKTIAAIEALPLASLQLHLLPPYEVRPNEPFFVVFSARDEYGALFDACDALGELATYALVTEDGEGDLDAANGGEPAAAVPTPLHHIARTSRTIWSRGDISDLLGMNESYLINRLCGGAYLSIDTEGSHGLAVSVSFVVSTPVVIHVSAFAKTTWNSHRHLPISDLDLEKQHAAAAHRTASAYPPNTERTGIGIAGSRLFRPSLEPGHEAEEAWGSVESTYSWVIFISILSLFLFFRLGKMCLQQAKGR